MRVLIVAPEVPNAPILDAATESARIGDIAGVEAVILAGREVTRDRLLNRLQRGPYELALWIGHGEPSRLILSDGSTIDPRWLADQLLFAQVKIAVLSVCWSMVRPSTSAPVLGFTDTIPALGVSLVAMSTDVGDKAAAEYDVAFVQSLASGASTRRAHETALEAIAKLGAADIPQLFAADPLSSAGSLKRLNSEVASLEHSIANGEPIEAHKNLVQITAIVEEIDRRLAETYHVTFRNSAAIAHLESRVDLINARINPPIEVQVYRAGIAFGIVTALVILVVPQARALVFASPPFAAFQMATIAALTALSWRGMILAQRKSRNGGSGK